MDIVDSETLTVCSLNKATAVTSLIWTVDPQTSAEASCPQLCVGAAVNTRTPLEGEKDVQTPIVAPH